MSSMVLPGATVPMGSTQNRVGGGLAVAEQCRVEFIATIDCEVMSTPLLSVKLGGGGASEI